MTSRIPFAVGLLTLFLAACDKGPDKDFYTDAVKGNAAELQIGALAASKGAREEVRSYGAMLQADHADAQQRVVAAAHAAGVQVDQALTKDAQSEYDKLAKLEGDAFDTEFVDHMIKDHQKDIAAYEKATKSSDARAAKYAADTLPALRKHLETAQTLKK
jgi:putative membrane protein